MNNSKGAMLILTSAFFYGSYGIWSRLMGGGFGEFAQAWTRGLFLLVVVWLINLRFHIFRPLIKKDIPWLLVIGLAGGLNQAPYYFGFQHLKIGTATMLFYAALVVGGYLLGKVFFAEKLTIVKIVSLVLAVVGMLFIYRFELTPSQIVPATLTIVAGVLGSATVILPRKLRGGYPEFQIMISYFLIQILFNGSLSFILRDSLPSIGQPVVWAAQLAYATAMLLANWAAIEGYRHFDASVGSLIGLAEIIFGVIFGIIFFGESLTASVFIGCLIILISAALPHFCLRWSVKNFRR